MQNNYENRKDILLPPAELFEKYDKVSPGISKELVEIVKKEQQHRHNLQKKYLWHYRLGQVFGIVFGFYTINTIYKLFISNHTMGGCALTAIFTLIVLLVIQQYKSDKKTAILKSIQKQASFNNGSNRHFHSRQYSDNRKKY